MNVPADIPHREMYWHIASPCKYFIYPLALIALIIFAVGLYRRYKIWKLGQPDKTRFGNWGERIIKFLWEVLFQARVLKDPTGGLLHVLIFWSFLALLFTTMIVFLDVDFGVRIYRGWFYLAVTMLAEVAGLAMLAGVIIAAWRRYVTKNKRLDSKWDDAFVLALLFALVVTGFFLEGMRIYGTGDPWASWSPVGQLAARTMSGWDEAGLAATFQTVWWFHFALLFTFIMIIPFTKFLHILTVPVNILFASLEPKGSMTRPDIEALMESAGDDDEFTIGISTLKDLTWKQRLDLDACIHCGRCQEACPAFSNDKPLNPKRIILDIRDFQEAGLKATKAGKNGEAGKDDENPPIIDGAFNTDPIWECRTCRACMEECPAHIEHLPLIIGLRRSEVLMKGEFPAEGAQALTMMERGGNPFGPQQTRSEWATEDKHPVLPEGGSCEALYFIGCCTSYDLLKRKVAKDLLGVMSAGGVNVGTLGDEEICCGDPAKLFGEENLFQTSVKTQVEAIKSRKFEYLVTHCPHGYNTFKNEYPQFMDPMKVFHHTELIHRLLKEGKINFSKALNKKITYHDPCYLGRYNDIYEQPREILKSLGGVRLVEMKHNRSKSMCCGAGGGHFWMDIETGKRINVARVQEAIDTGAEIIAVGCIFCHQMIDDAIKILNADDKIKVMEISELVAEAMGLHEGPG